MKHQTLTITLDQQPRDVPVGSSLAALIEALQLPAPSVATAVNGQFVPRAQREQCLLQADDAVLLFKPIVGG